jgi:hypothetical protein
MSSTIGTLTWQACKDCVRAAGKKRCPYKSGYKVLVYSTNEIRCDLYEQRKGGGRR